MKKSKKAEVQTDAKELPETNRADVNRLGYIGRTPTERPRDADSWFTPGKYIDSVRQVMTGIDLDPFTSDKANEIVRASHIFTLENSAFENEWNVEEHVRVFMNPPYSSGLCGRAIAQFIEQHEAMRFSEGIVLVNNATDTRWFRALISRCSAVCFTDHRISFWNTDRKNVSGNTRGQAFFYFGRRITKFKNTFATHGCTLRPLK